MVIVAQLVRVPDCGSGGRGFEPRLSPQMKNLLLVLVIAGLFSCSLSSDNSVSQADSTATLNAAPVDVLDTTGGKGVFFVELKDSQEVKSPVMVKMGVNGMEIEPAGAINELKGHHHIIIDGEATPEGQPVLLDETHFHFGQGQTESEMKLSSGFHTITLQFANGVHASYGSRWSKTITVKVK